MDRASDYGSEGWGFDSLPARRERPGQRGTIGGRAAPKPLPGGQYDRLAAISGPDVYDMERNPTGTQRNVNLPHARESRDITVPISDLTEREENQLVAVFDEAISTSRIRAPFDHESEPAYTANVLMPIAEGLRHRLGIEGVTLAGEGTSRVVPTYLLGHRFYPDIALSFYGRRLAAYEVKFLRASGRPNSMSTAIGQCLLYQLDRYPRARAVLIDWVGISRQDVEHCHSLLSRQRGVDVIYRAF
jgi:hypothetical protein